MFDEAVGNVFPRADLIGLSRKRRLREIQSSVKLRHLGAELADPALRLVRKNKTSAVVARAKSHDVIFEDRVWMLMYRMGFSFLTGDGGAVIRVPTPSGELKNQVDVLAADEDIVLAIECKSQNERGRRPQLQAELAKAAALREPIARSLARGAETVKRPIVMALWTYNAVHSMTDEERAASHSMLLLDQGDLEYYEVLVGQLGEAARFQFLADLVTGRPIPGLATRVPALRSKMGGYVCYTFSIAPSYLLKIAYVSHRARGKQSDLQTYQRMVSKARLRKIARYISDPDAAFPTNIVINLEKGKSGAGAQFERAKQEGDDVGATFGWLTLRPTYRSAWVIDGQHRLFAYALVPHHRAETSSLTVLAFEGLPGAVQQKLFVDINAEQKSVRRSLLQELYADLHRSASDPAKRTQSLISQAVQELNLDPDSPFVDRIQMSESPRTETRCVSLNAVFSALDRPGFYYRSVRDDIVEDPGPFWDSKSDAGTIRRTVQIVNGWFEAMLGPDRDWWNLGAAEGGGLAMNDGVTVCIGVLRSVVDHLGRGRLKLHRMTATEVVKELHPFAVTLGEYFARMSESDRAAFRGLRGQQGHTTGIRRAQAAIQERFDDFHPDGLKEFLDQEKAQTNERARGLISGIETLLAHTVIDAIKEEFGQDDDTWWYEGVPRAVRQKVVERQDEDKNSAGVREAYLDLVHYRAIALQNWTLLGPLVSYTRTGNKERRTDWIASTNEIRKVAMHASRGSTVTFEQLNELESYLAWFRSTVAGEVSSRGADGSEPDDPLEPATEDGSTESSS